MTKKLYIKTYGCQMNVYDSSRMGDVLAPLGYIETDSPVGADMVILNTCHIREKAVEKMYSGLGRIRIEKLAQEASGIFDVHLTKGLSLLTIRHFDKQTFEYLTAGKKILLQQQTQDTIQALMQNQ